ncbi:hypothetical protein BDR22DRAFT_76077 [Usnea florida]
MTHSKLSPFPTLHSPSPPLLIRPFPLSSTLGPFLLPFLLLFLFPTPLHLPLPPILLRHHPFKLTPQRLHGSELVPNGNHAFQRAVQLVDVLEDVFETLVRIEEIWLVDVVFLWKGGGKGRKGGREGEGEGEGGGTMAMSPIRASRCWWKGVFGAGWEGRVDIVFGRGV